MVAIQIEVVSDTLCPWCYVGKKNLDRAMDLYRQSNPNTIFQVLYKPFYLYPNLVRTGQAKAKLYEKMPVQIRKRVMEAGAEAGITFNFSDGSTGNSRRSHALLRLAARCSRRASASTATPGRPSASASVSPPDRYHRQSSTSSSPAGTPKSSHSPSPFNHGYTTYTTPPSSPMLSRGGTTTPSPPSVTSSSSASPPYPTTYPSVQSLLLDGLFRAHFEQGLDISSPAVLLRLAEEAGLPRAEALRVLESETQAPGEGHLGETDAEAAEARGPKGGVEGVPTYTVQGRWRVGGMQGVNVLLGVLERAGREGSDTVAVKRSGSVETVDAASHGSPRPRGISLRDILH